VAACCLPACPSCLPALSSRRCFLSVYHPCPLPSTHSSTTLPTPPPFFLQLQLTQPAPHHWWAHTLPRPPWPAAAVHTAAAAVPPAPAP
jgi:hypothetical protein